MMLRPSILAHLLAPLRANLLGTAGALLLAGCNLAPPYEKPSTVRATVFKEAVPAADAATQAEQGWKPADPKDAAPPTQWWEVYQDPDLNRLEEQVAISNQTVVGAEANYRASRALVSEAEASLFPTLSLAPTVTRSRSSASVSSISSVPGATTTTGTTTTGTTTTGTGSTSTQSTTTPRTVYSVPLEASYQVDLWGSVRNTIAQNRYNAVASAAEVTTALLSTQSQLAQDYFELRITDEERRVLDTTLEDYRSSLNLVNTLVKNGLDSDEDVSEAEAQLAAAEATATDLGVARAEYEHAIAVLIGVAPAEFSLPYKPLTQVLPAVPVGVPADLLERRADIATAERQVAAANANIGIARAAYFPSLTLSASGGYESTATGNLFNWPNRFWSFGPELAQTLFDGGALRAATAQARALEEQSAASYRETVLTAIQSVEDNLASLRILSQELKQQHAASVAAQRTVDLSMIRYRNGVDSYVNVITAQNTFLTDRETELQVQLKLLTASVNLINNLGGGWSTAALPETERFAAHPPADTSAAADATPPAPLPNPPPLPPRAIRPDSPLQQNQQSMPGAPAATGSSAPTPR